MLARSEIPGRRPPGNHEGARRDLQRRPQGPLRSRGADDKSFVPHRGAQDHDVSKYLAVGAFKHEQRVVARHHPQRASVYPSCCGRAR